jgi:type IV secretory pathway TraG/TraD family ATPase VirD4
VHVLDPYDLAGWPERLSWSLVDGCADFGVAQRRAEVLVATTKSEENTRGGGYFVNNARVLISCWLHAAALSEAGARRVLRWASSPDSRDATDILTNHDRPDLARAVGNIQAGGNSEERASTWKTASQPLAGLLNERVAKVFACPPDESLDLGSWLATGGTVYLIGEDDDHSLLTPLQAAFGRAAADAANRRAARATRGRLDPPLALIGDEIANSMPLPELPRLMSLAGGSGIFVLVSLQNLAQAEQRWGELGARQIFANATVKIVLGGISDPRELKMFSDAIGDYDQEHLAVTEDHQRVSVNASTRRRPILDPGMLRTIPKYFGVVIHRSTPATRVLFTRAHEGPRAADIAAAEQHARTVIADA